MKLPHESQIGTKIFFTTKPNARWRTGIYPKFIESYMPNGVHLGTITSEGITTTFQDFLYLVRLDEADKTIEFDNLQEDAFKIYTHDPDLHAGQAYLRAAQFHFYNS